MMFIFGSMSSQRTEIVSLGVIKHRQTFCVSKRILKYSPRQVCWVFEKTETRPGISQDGTQVDMTVFKYTPLKMQ